jgi:hypothetical protein
LGGPSAGHATTAESSRNLLLEARVAARRSAMRRGAQIFDEVLVERGAKQRAVILLLQ